MIVKLLSTLSLIAVSWASVHLDQVTLRLEEHYLAILLESENMVGIMATMVENDVYMQMLDDLLEPAEIALEDSTADFIDHVDSLVEPERSRVKYYIPTNHKIHWYSSRLGEVLVRMQKAATYLAGADVDDEEEGLRVLHLALGGGLYPILVDLKSQLVPQSQGFEVSSWLGILQQMHARILVSIFRAPTEWSALISDTEYVLAALVESAGGDGIEPEELEVVNAREVALRVGGVTIPDEVVEEAIGVGWCCLTACLRRCSGRDAVAEDPVADPPNGPVQNPPVNPAPAAASTVVFNAYIEQSLQMLAEILMDVAQVDGVSAEQIPATLLEIRNKYVVEITKMIRAMITNSPPSFDINPALTIQLHLFDILANNPPSIDWFATKREILESIKSLRFQFNAARQPI